MIHKSDMERIRLLIEENIGQRIKITVKKGRKKVLTRFGVINAVYPYTFNVTLESLSEFAEVDRNLSLNYTDILTHAIEITVLETETDIV